VERKKAADAAAKAADEAPVQAATFATPAGVETPAVGTGELWVGGDASTTASGDGAPASPVADAFGEPIDARVTEGTAELVVTPVAESVARTSAGSVEMATEGANGVVAKAEGVNANVSGGGSKTASETIAETKGHVVSIDVPHDQQPA
jgi:hypothetical protein